MLTLAKEPLNDPLISSQIKQFLNLNSMLRSRPSHLQIFSLLNFVFTVNPEWSCQNRYNHLQCFTLDYTWFFSPMSVHNLVYLGGVSRHYLQLICISFKWFIHNVDTLHINIGGSQHKPLNANLNDLDLIHQVQVNKNNIWLWWSIGYIWRNLLNICVCLAGNIFAKPQE